MGNSLLDQLNKTGLVGKNQAKQVKKEKHRQAKSQKGKQAKIPGESRLRAQQVLGEKAERDRELNNQCKLAAEKKAIAAQVKQLIEMNRIEEEDAEIGFNFVDGKNVQRFFVTEKSQTQLIKGRLAIVKLEGSYFLLPFGAVEKIKHREPDCVVHYSVENTNAGGNQVADSDIAEDADDLYADYQVPDDLMW